MKRRIIPDVVDGEQVLLLATAGETVRSIARAMAERRVGAVMVIDDTERLVGIATERDLVYRVVAEGRDPETVTVADIMTRAPVTIRSDEVVVDALKRMREGGFRHLPVVDDGVIRGMVSVRDLLEAVREELEEGLRSCEALVYGDRYALSSQH